MINQIMWMKKRKNNIGFLMIFSFFLVLLSCKNNSFDGKYIVESTMITVTSDSEDKINYHNDCLNKKYIIQNNKFIYSDSICNNFSKALIKLQYINIGILEEKHSGKFITLIKDNYKLRGVFNNENEEIEIYKRLDGKLIIYQDPYLMVLRNE